MANALVRDAALQAAPSTKRGMLERMFARMFEGLVYAQIWEDPEVDIAALELGPTSRLVTIASGGCNVMSYLTADPMRIQAVDLNPAHVALLQLKLTAARHLPHYEAFRSFFAEADTADNLRLYDRFVAPNLPPPSATYWNARDLAGRRRISIFAPQPLQPRAARPDDPARARGLPAARQAATAAARRARPRRTAPAV